MGKIRFITQQDGSGTTALSSLDNQLTTFREAIVELKEER